MEFLFDEKAVLLYLILKYSKWDKWWTILGNLI